jgi:DNA anti-recombination protein RmuC
MSLATIIAVSGIVGAVAGAIGTLAAARYTWHKDKRETAEAEQTLENAKSAEAREKEAADDRTADRLVELLKEANKLEIENERMKYELKLNDEITKLKQQHKRQMDEMRASIMDEMQRRIQEAFDIYSCENAAADPPCPNRRPRKPLIDVITI